MNEAAIQALRHGSLKSGMKILGSIEKVMLGERLDRKPREEERRRVAYHEIAMLVSESIRVVRCRL